MRRLFLCFLLPIAWSGVHTNGKRDQHRNVISESNPSGRSSHQLTPLSDQRPIIPVKSAHETTKIASYYRPVSALPNAAVLPEASYKTSIRYGNGGYRDYGHDVRRVHPPVLGSYPQSKHNGFITHPAQLSDYASEVDGGVGVSGTQELYGGHHGVQVKVIHGRRDQNDYTGVNILSGGGIGPLNLHLILAHLGVNRLESVHQIPAIANHLYGHPEKVVFKDHYGPLEKLHGHIQTFHSVRTLDQGGAIISHGKSYKSNDVLPERDFADYTGYEDFHFPADW